MKPFLGAFSVALVPLCSAVFLSPCTAATRVWISTDSCNWSDSDNWRPAGVPQNGDTLIFDTAEEGPGTGLCRTMHNDLVGLQVRRLEYCGQGDGTRPPWSLDGNELTLLEYVGFRRTNYCGSHSFTFHCPLKLGGPTFMQTSEASGTLILRGPIDLNGNDLHLWNGHQMIISSQIGGAGNITATADSFFGKDSKIVFDGSTGNTFTGKLIVRQIYEEAAEVIFDKQFGHVVNDALLIGDDTFSLSARLAVCKLARPHQIGDNAEVCLTGGSRLLLQGHTETIGSLCLTNNSGDTQATLVDTGGSTLSVLGNITAVNDSAAVTPTIRGKLGLPGSALQSSTRLTR